MWTKWKKLILASLGSVLIHLIVLLIFGVLVAMTPAKRDARPTQPIRLVITPPEPTPTPLPILLGAAPTPTPAQRHYTDTRDMAEAKQPSLGATAESDKDTAASSELPPTGNLNAPSQKGRKVPNFMFDTHEYAAEQSASESAATPAPAPATAPPLPTPSQLLARADQTPRPVPTPVATPAPTPKADEFAMFDPTPTPTPEPFDPFVRAPADEAARVTPAPGSRQARMAANRSEEKSQIDGNIANAGPASMAALATPQGRYKKAVSEAIGQRWYAWIDRRLDTASPGNVTVAFQIDRDGKVIAPRLIKNTGNEALASACMQAIMDAHIPPIPDEVAASIKSPNMPLIFDFSMY